MREIKFRAWDTKVRRWFDCGIDLINRIFLKENEQKIFEIDTNISNIKVMQYTGLTDKNGVEIYEGDVVEWYIREYKCIAVISYSNGYYKAESITNNYFIEPVDYKLCEVVGNIYENKELLDREYADA